MRSIYRKLQQERRNRRKAEEYYKTHEFGSVDPFSVKSSVSTSPPDVGAEQVPEQPQPKETQKQGLPHPGEVSKHVSPFGGL